MGQTFSLEEINCKKRLNILKQFGVKPIVKGNIEKSEQTEALNPFDEMADNIEKGMVMDSLDYSSDIKISKTGKEIADSITAKVLPVLNLKLGVLKAKADEWLKTTGTKPTRDLSNWDCECFELTDFPYKQYDWQETYFNTNTNKPNYGFEVQDVKNNKILSLPTSQEEAESREEYNNTVRKICECIVDLKACGMLQALKPEKEYALIPRQFIQFGF